jgi:hypothetical protein
MITIKRYYPRSVAEERLYDCLHNTMYHIWCYVYKLRLGSIDEYRRIHYENNVFRLLPEYPDCSCGRDFKCDVDCDNCSHKACERDNPCTQICQVNAPNFYYKTGDFLCWWDGSMFSNEDSMRINKIPSRDFVMNMLSECVESIAEAAR